MQYEWDGRKNRDNFSKHGIRFEDAGSSPPERQRDGRQNDMNEVTDWKRLDAMSDKDIDLSDIPECDDAHGLHAKMNPPLVKKNTVLLDSDVYAWFVAQGPDYLETINALLRSHMEARRA